jgi:hypothetical protein
LSKIQIFDNSGREVDRRDVKIDQSNAALLTVSLLELKPGNYKVVLTANGQKFTQPLTIVPDPRVSLPASAYAEQFAFAREVEQTRASLAAALSEAAALVKRTDISDALRHKAIEVSGTISGDDFTAPPPSESSIRFINQALGKLANAVDSADGAPTPDARASWAKLKPAADAALAAWAGVKGEAPPAKP